MICSLILAGVMAQSPDLLSAKFDLSDMRSIVAAAVERQSVRAERYTVDPPAWDDQPDSGGVQIKFRWKRVRVRIPIPSI